MQLFSYSTASAQHMTLEGGYYNCEDDQIGWYLSLIPCDGMIVTPDETYSICTICGEKFQTSEIIDHEYICYLAHQNGDDPFNNSSSNNNGNTGNPYHNGGGSHGSGNNSNGGNGYNYQNNNSTGNRFYVVPNTPVGYEGALIAGFGYDDGDKYSKELEESYHWIENSSIPQESNIIMHDLESGFDCRFMIKKDKQGKIVGFVLTFAGTDFLNNQVYQVNSPNGTDYVVYNPDIITDITQLFGMCEQYEQALINARRLSDYLKNDSRYKDIPLTFVGHSLGGGMAALASIVTGHTAITYNPAGLSSNTLSWLQENGYGHDTSHILQYIADRDEVHIAQTLGNIESQGSVIWVPNVQSCAFEHPISSMIANLKK